MSVEKDHEQFNVLDGTVYIVEEHPGSGAYVTIAGRDDQPYIIALDLEDLKVMAEVANSVKP